MGTKYEHRGPAKPDATDVVTGPVGRAKLRNPATSAPEGADLAELPKIEPDLRPDQRKVKETAR